MKLIANNSEMINKNFSQQPSYTDELPKVDIGEEYRAESTLSCASMCGHCSCIGYQHATKTCRVFDFCNYQKLSGWVYYKTQKGQ